MFVQRLLKLDRLSEVQVQSVVKLQLEVSYTYSENSTVGTIHHCTAVSPFPASLLVRVLKKQTYNVMFLVVFFLEIEILKYIGTW